MIHEDIQLALPDKSTPRWHKSPSLSSATTTDEDFSTGSPKQRWADLSEEDDDLLTSERSPFGLLQTEVKEMALNSAAECADETKMPHAGTKAHNSRSHAAHGSLTAFDCHDHADLERRFARTDPYLSYDRKRGETVRQTGSLRGAALPFTMLPPSFNSHGPARQPAMGAPLAQNDGVATKETFTVTLSGIPPKLCNDACLDAILWASGVQRSALGYHTKKNGYIVVNFCTSEAATHCYNHFKSCSWATGRLQVDLVLPSSPRTRSNGRKHDVQSFPCNRRLSKHTRSELSCPADVVKLAENLM